MEIQFYGLYAAVNERVTLFNEDPVLNSFSNLLGISLRRTEDALIRDVILSSATFLRALGGNNGDIPTNPAPSDFDSTTTILQGNDAMMMLMGEGGQDRFGSQPIQDAFLGLCHTDMIPSLNATPGFVKKFNYSNPHAAVQHSEWGNISNVRVFVSSQGAVLPNASTLNQNIYPITIMGIESVASISQDSFSSQFVYRPAYINDPLAQNCTMAYVTALANAIIDDEWVLNLFCTAV